MVSGYSGSDWWSVLLMDYSGGRFFGRGDFSSLAIEFVGLHLFLGLLKSGFLLWIFRKFCCD